MEHDFWHDKWENNQIGFHLNYVHPILKRHLALFQIPQHGSIFVPLCGKTQDIRFLLERGYHVVAVELSEMAVQQIFEEMALQPRISDWQQGKLYQTDALRIFVGDFFALSEKELSADAAATVSLVYDRAALVALPEAMRRDYAQHITQITAGCPQLLITLDYDQSVAAGPPFAVTETEVNTLYAQQHSIELLEQADIIAEEPRFKAKGLTAFYQRGYCLS